MAGQGNFVAANGTLRSAPGGDLGLLWSTTPTAADFTLRCEWRIAQPNDNSGIFVRFPNPNSKGYNNTAYVAVHFGFEVQIDETGAPDGADQHIVLVRGDWVYDAGHAGWNEIHPVRYVQRLDNVPADFDGTAIASAELVERFAREVLDPWCLEVGRSEDPIVVEAQAEPENSWHIHPSVDGCREPVVVE